jgi:hypothetical protein
MSEKKVFEHEIIRSSLLDRVVDSVTSEFTESRIVGINKGIYNVGATANKLQIKARKKIRKKMIAQRKKMLGVSKLPAGEIAAIKEALSGRNVG